MLKRLRCLLLMASLSTSFLVSISLIQLAKCPSNEFDDDFSFDSGMWEYLGNAHRDQLNQYLVLTGNVNSQRGVVFFSHKLRSCFTASFSYRAGGGSGADGFVMFLYNKKYNSFGSGGSLAYTGPGYGIEFDNWYSSERNDPSSNHIALVKDSANNHLLNAYDSRTEDNKWHNVSITVGWSSVKVQVDHDVVLQWNGVIDRSFDCLGFSASTGAYNNWHIIDNFSIRIDRVEESWVDTFTDTSKIEEVSNLTTSDGDVKLDTTSISAGNDPVASNDNYYLVNGWTDVDLTNPVSSDGKLTQWQIYGFASGTAKLKVFRDNSTHYLFVGETGYESFTVGLNTFSCSIVVKKGDIVGTYVSSGNLDVKVVGDVGSEVAREEDVNQDLPKSSWGIWNDTLPIHATGFTYSLHGSLRSVSIAPSSINEWNALSISKTEPMGANITVSVLDGATNQAISGFANLSGTLIDLSPIDPTIYPTLKLSGVLEGTALVTPVLHDWGVSWYAPTSPPVISNLTPLNNSHISSRDLVFTWQTSVDSTSEVFIKSEDETAYTSYVGESALYHVVVVANLSRNKWYSFYVRSSSPHGSASSVIRNVYVENGIIFSQRMYSFTIERDYDQQASLSVENTDSESHQLLLTVASPYDDLIVGFVGEGSTDETIIVGPEESKEVKLVFHAQDTQTENYALTLNLTTLEEDPIVSDFAYCNVHVVFPNINVTLVERLVDPWTLAKTLRVTNYGDSITDLTINCTGELVGKVVFRPVIQHYYFASGASLDFNVVPILTENFTQVSGYIVAEGSGAICASLLANFTLPLGKNVYRVAALNVSIEFSPYYDNDESPNTNPTMDNQVESYIINGRLFFFSQIIIDVYQNNVPVSGANVSLTIWNGSTSLITYTSVLFLGKACFDLIGVNGTYNYQATLVDFGLSTEVRTFSVSSQPLFTIHPREISWINAGDGNTTFPLITENCTIKLDAAPFTFRAEQASIEENATLQLVLAWEYDPYKTLYIPGDIQNDTLIFETETIPFGNYSAYIVSYSPSHGLASSFPIKISCTDRLALYQNGNYSFNLPLSLNSTHMIKLTVNHSISSRHPNIAFDLHDINTNGSDYQITFMVKSNTTATQQFQLKAMAASGETILNETILVSMESGSTTALNVTIPMWEESQLYEFNITLSTESSDLYLSVQPAIEYTFNRFIWVGGQTGVRPIEYFYTFFRCGVGISMLFYTGSIKMVGEALLYLHGVDALEHLLTQTPGFWDALTGSGIAVMRKEMSKSSRAWIREMEKPEWTYLGLTFDMVDCFERADRLYRQDMRELIGYEIGLLDAVEIIAWYCTNRPRVWCLFLIPPPLYPVVFLPVGTEGTGAENTGAGTTSNDLDIDVYFAARFLLPWSRSSYRPHDVDILLNSVLVAEINNSILEGHYAFQVDAGYLNFLSTGTASNIISLQTSHMNGGHYVVTTDMLGLIVYKNVTVCIVASSLEEAQSKIYELVHDRFANKPDPCVFPEDIKLEDQPFEGMQKIDATVWNLGAGLAFQVPVQVFDGENLIADALVTIPAFQNVTFSVDWNATVGSHQIRIVVDPNDYRDELNEENNQASRSISVQEKPSDVAVIEVVTSKAQVYRGRSLNINATIENQGGSTQTFDVTAYANTTSISSVTDVTLASGSITTLTFTWNTTGFPYGSYTISAYAWPVPGETDTTDNIYVFGPVLVSPSPIQGDVDSNGIVDINDIIIWANAFGSQPGDPDWNPEVNLVKDNTIDIFDAIMIAVNFGETWPP